MQIKRLYNLFALILSAIVHHTNEHDFEKMRNMDTRHEIVILEGLKEKFPELFDKETRNVAEVSEFQLMNSNLIQNLEIEIVECKNMEELIYLARCLDSFLEDSFYSCIPMDKDWHVFQGLNDNAKECGLYLLPRVKCNWEHKSRDAHTSYSIFYYLRNFYFVCKSELNDYTVQHILVPRKVFYPALKRGELRVAVSPGTDRKIVEVTEPYIRDDTCYVSVKPMEASAETELMQIFFNVLRKTAEEEADILLLPEMLGSNAILESLSMELDAREMVPDNEFPKFIACPTIWKEHRNSCTVLDDTGDLIFEQYKHHGVDMKQPRVKEDIETDRIIYILHCFGVGRIAVAICRDFLITSYLRILAEKLRVNLLLVPSFTSGDYHFEMLLPKYSDLDCNVIWVNSCSSRWLNANGAVATHATRAYMAGKRGMNTEEISVSELCGHRSSCESGCIFIYRISLDKEVGI